MNTWIFMNTRWDTRVWKAVSYLLLTQERQHGGDHIQVARGTDQLRGESQAESGQGLVGRGRVGLPFTGYRSAATYQKAYKKQRGDIYKEYLQDGVIWRDQLDHKGSDRGQEVIPQKLWCSGTRILVDRNRAMVVKSLLSLSISLLLGHSLLITLQLCSQTV